MPSLFSRPNTKRTKAQVTAFTTPTKGRDGILVTTTSTGGRGSRNPSVGEFGTVASSSKTLPARPSQPLTPPDSPSVPPVLPPKYIFLPTDILPSPLANTSNRSSTGSGLFDDGTDLRAYGCLGGFGSRITLGLADVGKVIKDVGQELERRGLATPMLFSNQAWELSQTRTRMPIQAYLNSLYGETSDASRRQARFQQDIKVAMEHELAWLLRWALSRLVRKREGTGETLHGVLEWEIYEEWRGRERAANYPIDAFPFLSVLLVPQVYHVILTPLMHLLSRFAAHSHLSALTPHALSSLFAPLLFDIPTATPAMKSHAAFVRAASATEHFLLSYIRSTASGKDGLGLSDLPSRLKEWVSGYPAMLATDADLARGGPRRGARVVRCERAFRTVRAYSKDLIVQAESWAADIPGEWEAWDRVILHDRRGDAGRAKFAPSWRRRMAVKEVLPLPKSTSAPSNLERPMSYGRARRPGQHDERRQSGTEDDEEGHWNSLAGKEWSMFEEGGFDAPMLSNLEPDDMRSRLQFDLNESAKISICERRKTMDWTDFAAPSGGFSRTEPLLVTSLSFARPLETQISDWPQEREELHKRLYKSQKGATPFAYDTTPRIGSALAQDSTARSDSQGRVYVEEAFVDCWADLMMGGGWLDREELTFKEANWAIIEYKACPNRHETPPLDDPLADPRTSDTYFLFEECVPLEYQLAVADPKQKKTFAKLFSPKSKKHNTPQNTPGLASGWRDSDFDRMLLHRQKTKKLTLATHDPLRAAVLPTSPDPGSPMRSPMFRQRTRSIGNTRGVPDEMSNGEGRPSFFSKTRERTIRRVKTEEEQRARARKEREHEVDFELHSASGLSSGNNSPEEVGRKLKSDEKWMDILIANGARKMERQDAPRVPPRLASKSELEVARVLVPPPANLLPGPKPVEDEHVNEPLQVPLDDPGDRRPSLVIMKPFPPIPSDPPGSDFVPSSEPPESPRTPPDLGRSFASTEISSPTPQQDTIHNIVGTDNRDSMLSASSTDQPGSEALTDVEEEDMLAPPGPIFDLTPGREPSPARYRHGEPLQFVGEESEEE